MPTKPRPQTPAKGKSAVVEIKHEQCMFGRMSGDLGASAYVWINGEGDEQNQLAGVSLAELLGVQLGHGARVRVTVELIQNKPMKRNPWIDEDRKRARRALNTASRAPQKGK